MGELLAGVSVGQVGLLGTLVLVPWGLLAFAVRRIITGDLVTTQQVLDARADRDKWHTAHDIQQQIALKHGMTLERLLVLAETSDHALSQIQAGLQFRPEDR